MTEINKIKINYFKKYLRENGCSENTIRSYSSTASHFLSKYEAVTSENLIDYRNSLLNSRKSSTINQKINAINRYIKFENNGTANANLIKVRRAVYIDNVISNVEDEIKATQEERQKYLESLKKLNPWLDLHVYGFIDYLDELVKLSDCVVMKAGPATLLEVLSCKKPVIICRYIHNQEKGNMMFAVDNKVGYFIQRPSKIYDKVEELLNDEKFDEKMEKNFETIPKEHLAKTTFDYKERIRKYKEDVDLNQQFLNKVIQKFKPEKKYYDKFKDADIESFANEDHSHMDYAVFMYIVRDWTETRAQERKEHYEHIIEEVKSNLTDKSKKYNVLVPGSALSRLVFEIAKLGHNVECNDYSYFNCAFCKYLFNYAKKDEFTFAPLIRCFSNYLTEASIFRRYSFPCDDLSRPEGAGDIHMSPGDFVAIYKDQKEKYDCVITCFFIDTAKNVIEYIDVIYNCLKKGGIWINFGPLSYHWSGLDAYISIELPYDKLREVITNYGFEFTKQSQRDVVYCGIDEYLMNEIYHSLFFTCIKK